VAGSNHSFLEADMRGLVILAVILLVLWVVGLTVLRITTGLIHLVLVVALVLFILGFIRRGTGTRV
jgi:hypothetical protein